MNELHKIYQDNPSNAQNKFNYAWALIRTSSDAHTGLALLKEIYAEIPARRRECLYYLALGEFKIGQYRNARQYCDTLLAKEPNNPQAKDLMKQIDNKVRSEGAIGFAIAGGLALGVGLLVGLMKRK